jgi:hypothetical protein
MVRKLVLAGSVWGLLVFAGASAAFADTTGSTGQPGQSCQVTTTTPGSAAAAPGSAFNPTGQAGNVYAGNAPQNSINPNSVSQYDVACFQQTTH